MAERFAAWKDFPKRQRNGRWLCRWCARPCSGRRENFCSATCQVEVAVRCERKALRHYTYIRDRGLCAECDCDTLWLRDELDVLRQTDRAAWLDQLACLGFTRKEGLKSLWQADHITPVAVTGPVGLDDLQTLCTRCHKVKSARELMATKRVKKLKKVKKAKRAAPPAKPTKFREKGLWLSAVSVRIEEVRKAHKAPCIHCGKRPELRRLKVTRGAGRAGVTELYCADCGMVVLARMQMEAQRAYYFLLEGRVPVDDGAIRLADPMFEAVKAAHKARQEERQRKKAERERAATG